MRRTIHKDDFKQVVTSSDPEFDAQRAPRGADSYATLVRQSFTECVFVAPDYYVQTITDLDDTVLAFSVTTRSPRFRPTYALPFRCKRLRTRHLWRFKHRSRPLINVELGRTRFADPRIRSPIDLDPSHFRVTLGARNWSYSEIRYLGNPGFYLTVVLTASNVAGGMPVGDVAQVQRQLGGARKPDPDNVDLEPAWENMPAFQQFRSETVVSTYTVIGLGLWVENYPSTFGASLDDVRTLP
jgi:hypothetical protein